MEQKIDCAVVKDLLPNYAEHLTSNETNAIIEQHFQTCPDCRNFCNELLRELPVEPMPESRNIKKYMKKTKQMYILKGMIATIGLLGILVSFIVDLAVNRRLTWSLIVDLSVIYCYAVGITALSSSKHRIYRILFVSSVLLLPMLAGFEWIINRNFISEPIDWFQEYALPISLLWIFILWITVLLYSKLHSLWFTLSIFFLFVLVGSLATNCIAEKQALWTILWSKGQWINIPVYLFLSVFCFWFGIRKKASQRNHTKKL